MRIIPVDYGNRTPEKRLFYLMQVYDNEYALIIDIILP
jgi:hypothetical protein